MNALADEWAECGGGSLRHRLTVASAHMNDTHTLLSSISADYRQLEEKETKTSGVRLRAERFGNWEQLPLPGLSPRRPRASAVCNYGHVDSVAEDAHVAQGRLQGDGREGVDQDATHGEGGGGHEERSLKPAAPAIVVRVGAAATEGRGLVVQQACLRRTRPHASAQLSRLSKACTSISHAVVTGWKNTVCSPILRLTRAAGTTRSGIRATRSSQRTQGISGSCCSAAPQ